MSDKVGKGISGPVNMHKALAAGESLAEAQAAATGKTGGTHQPAKTPPPGRNTK